MHKRLSDFLKTNNILYNLQFGFRKKHSTSHALTSLVENIYQALDKGEFACAIFIDLQKAFDTVDINILLSKLNYYGIRGVANDWFKSFLTNRKQNVNIDGIDSNTLDIDIGVPQGSVLGPLLFSLYINDLQYAIKYCQTRLFADDTNILKTDKSLKTINKLINFDLKNLWNWLCSNKISLNVSKTELIIFRPRGKNLDYKVDFRLNKERIYPSTSVKYLGLDLDEHLTWKNQTNILSNKLNKANAMISKIRHFVDTHTIKSIYFALFNSHLSYGCLSWGCNNSNSKRLFVLQKKAVRLMEFAQRDSPSNPIFHNLEILKLEDLVKVESCLFINKSINKQQPEIFNDWFNFSCDSHAYPTRNANIGTLNVNAYNSHFYGRCSFSNYAIKNWNFLQRSHPSTQLSDLSISQLKNLLKSHFLDSYKA